MSQHPTAVVIPPRVPRHDRVWTPWFSERLPIIVQTETAPGPIDDSAFAGVGKTSATAVPHRWRAQGLAIRARLAVQAPYFGVERVVRGTRVLAPGNQRQFIGGMNPTVERAGIVAPSPTSLSDRAAVYPLPQYAPQYAKII